MTAGTPSREAQRHLRTLADHLEGAPTALSLPADRSRPTALTTDVATLEVTLDEKLTRDLRSLAERVGAGLDVVLLTGFRVLLSRTAEEDDAVVGAAGPGGTAGVTVVRGPVFLDGGLRANTTATNEALSTAAAFTRGTVEDLVRDLGVEPGPTKHPVFQVGFVHSVSDSSPEWPDTWPTPPDLVLACGESDERIRLRLDWAAELFDRWRMSRLSQHLVRLLAEGVADPESPVGSLPLLAEDDIADLTRWNATDHPHDPDAPLAARFWRQVEQTPDAPAVEHHGRAVSYKELGDRAAQLAAHLHSLGVKSDVTVVVCAERSIEMVVGVLGVLMAGGAYVPVDPTYPDARREVMIGDSGATVLLTLSRLRDSVPEDYRGHVVLLDEPVADRTVPALPSGGSGRDLGYVIYTSGSTGRPKGVAMPQAALDNLVGWQLRRPQFSEAARTLQFSSLSFDVSFQELFTTWASGGTLVLVDDATRRDPLRLLDYLIAHRVQRLFLPFVALRGLAAAVAATGRVPTTLTEVYTAGEQLRADDVVRDLFRALPGCVLENQYGPSESHVVTAHTLGRDPADWPLLPPIGTPIDNSQAHVLDPAGGRRPVGVPGELYLGGACLARGYLGRPDLTDERFIPAPAWAAASARLYRTGDVVRWLPTGELEYLGRTDHQVKFRGYRIEPAEVGAVLSSAPGVGQCVAAVREGEGGARLTAWLVAAEDEAPELGQVHRYARRHLPAYMVPSHYLVVPELPLTASGKVDTASLPDAAFDRSVLSAPYQAPSDRHEEVVAEIWSTLLGVPEVGVLDDFFELGGDSLIAAEMTQRVAEQLGQEMPLGALAQAPTIAGLAALLRDDQGDRWGSLVPLQVGDPAVTPLFIVHGGSGNIASFPRLARGLPQEQPVYALQWDGLDGSRGQRTIEDMAAHYLAEVRTVQSDGPYRLAGQCIGGLVAREMTRQLLGQGEQVELLVMYDSPHLGSRAYVPARWPAPRQLASKADVRRTAIRDLALAVFRKLPTRDPVRRSSRAMRTAALRHRPAPLPRPVPTIYIGSGEWQGRNIALSGHWTDGAMGWAEEASSDFTIHRVEGDHNEILYDPAAIAIVTDALRSL
ncbi:amino acid adenylation domain-containing protein [Blastococcus sp. HT6-30]|uniref:non-ribosomal peptide synthetase n=1 Tax=Blastococcus sp. HT6-30 TaxID=3144843 RepID=UPI00321983F1